MKALLHYADLILHLDKYLEWTFRHYGSTPYVVVFLFIASVEGYALRRRGGLYDARTYEPR